MVLKCILLLFKHQYMEVLLLLLLLLLPLQLMSAEPCHLKEGFQKIKKIKIISFCNPPLLLEIFKEFLDLPLKQNF